MKLKEHFTWSNGAEGEFSATGFAPELCENSIGFHGERYLEDLAKFKRNNEQSVSISFIAFYIQKLPECKIGIEKGMFYDMQLKEFLKDNPHKTKADFIKPTLVIDAEHFRMFSATDYACEYTIAAPIVNISKTIMFGKEIYKLRVNLAHQDEEPCYLNVYSGKENFKEYRPKIGDGIMASGKCMGYFLG